MALCRCEAHSPLNNRTNEYTHWVLPVGYPDTSAMCGDTLCPNPGKVYLTGDEFERFKNGQVIFRFPTNASKVKVQPPNYDEYTV